MKQKHPTGDNSRRKPRGAGQPMKWITPALDPYDLQSGEKQTSGVVIMSAEEIEALGKEADPEEEG